MAGLNRITAVAQTTFRETIRNRILLNMLGFAVAMFGLAWVVSNWSIGEPEKIITDLGLTITVFAGVIIAIFAGIVLVHGEVERQTILPILAKPLPRWEFVVGKFVGFSVAVLVVFSGMNLILLLLLALVGMPLSSQIIQAMYISAWEVELVVAIALLFSSFTTPTISALLTIMLFIAGRFSGDVKIFIENYPQTIFKPVLAGVYAIIPHLSYFNMRHAAVHTLEISTERLVWSSLYGLSYCLIVLFIASLVFRSRDLA